MSRPADNTSLPVSPARFALKRGDFDAGSAVSFRFTVENPYLDGALLHLRFPAESGSVARVTPEESALGPGEKQAAVLAVDSARARTLLASGQTTGASLTIPLQYTYLREASPPSRGEGFLFVRLPIAACPSCGKIVADDDASDHGIPDVCPFCFERLRTCPICGTPNSWLARRCIADDTHVVRGDLDFPIVPGGDAAHTGTRGETRTALTLSRRWSSPSVAPTRRENAFIWSAPAAAYGLVACAGSDFHGDAFLAAWNSRTGATLWESYPLPNPVYPERGAVALAGGKLYAATVEGVCVCLDALRGTRVWETVLPRETRVFGAVLPITLAGSPVGDATGPADLLLIPATQGEQRDRGALFLLNAETGALVGEVGLAGGTDTAPAFADGRIFTHDDSGTLSAFAPTTGELLWQAPCGAGFDAAPVVSDGGVFSATSGGEVLRHDAATGALTWRLAVTNAPLSGTPACDGSLLYVPADDGLHVLSAAAGRSVRRFGARRPVRSSPVVAASGTVFWGATDGNVYGVRGGGTAEALYSTGTPGSQITASLVLTDGALFLTATNGVIYALDHGTS